MLHPSDSSIISHSTVHLWAGNLYIIIYFHCDIHLYFYDFSGNIKKGPKLTRKGNVFLSPLHKFPCKSCFYTPEETPSSLIWAFPLPHCWLSNSTQRNECFSCPTRKQSCKVATCCPTQRHQHPLLLDTEPLQQCHLQIKDKKHHWIVLFCYSSSQCYFSPVTQPPDVSVPPLGMCYWEADRRLSVCRILNSIYLRC